MKNLILFLMVMISAVRLPAQDSLNSLTELQRLLKERQDRFQNYAMAADKRSGIFGKTKKDLEESREILLSIVQTDNRILEELNRVISLRGMAKADYSVDMMEYERTIDRLTLAADTLNKQLIAQKDINESLKKKGNTQRLFLYPLVVILGILLFFLLIRRRKQAYY